MAEGEIVVYIRCRSCGHEAIMPHEAVASVPKRRLRCSKCGEKRADVTVAWKLAASHVPVRGWGKIRDD